MTPNVVHTTFHDCKVAVGAGFQIRHLIPSFETVCVELGADASRKAPVPTDDTLLRVDWTLPMKTFYGGYSSLALAEEAVRKAEAYGGLQIAASIFPGLPSIGVVTVEFRFVPGTADETWMQRFEPEDLMWCRPDYDFKPLQPDEVTNRVKSILRSSPCNASRVDVCPPPYARGLVRAWATFPTSDAAHSAARLLRKIKAWFGGPGHVFVRQFRTLSLSFPLADFKKHVHLFGAFRSAVRQKADVVVDVKSLTGREVVTLAAVRLQDLRELKSELETLLTGETLSCDGVPLWHRQFTQRTCIQRVMADEARIRVEVDPVRCRVKLFGVRPARAAARAALLRQLADVDAQRVRTITVRADVARAFLAGAEQRICADFEPHTVSTNVWRRTITVRGPDTVYRAVEDALHDAEQACPSSSTSLLCPICRCNILSPVALPCGHECCKACMLEYLLASDAYHFPLRCLEGDCPQLVPLDFADMLLSPTQYTSVIHSAVTSYLRQHTDVFRYCPSPNCHCIYRTEDKAGVVRCPSCLILICPACNVEAHPGFECRTSVGSDLDRLFDEWKAGRDVKECPRCKYLIERDQGCYHVLCTCGAHICWVCLETFDQGATVYEHLNARHGTIGLPQQP
ncbi:hypothetical protein C8R43DRAFT_872512 [Mycena crocata]|nr:hypothetical protein C8R43DRAFT_872512 [Mycena crocata]